MSLCEKCNPTQLPDHAIGEGLREMAETAHGEAVRKMEYVLERLTNRIPLTTLMDHEIPEMTRSLRRFALLDAAASIMGNP